MTAARTTTDDHGNAGYTPVVVKVHINPTPIIDGHNHPPETPPLDYHVCPGCTGTVIRSNRRA